MILLKLTNLKSPTRSVVVVSRRLGCFALLHAKGASLGASPIPPRHHPPQVQNDGLEAQSRTITVTMSRIEENIFTKRTDLFTKLVNRNG